MKTCYRFNSQISCHFSIIGMKRSYHSFMQPISMISMRVYFVTFSRILGFGEEHRGYTYIHDEPRVEISDIRYMWRGPK